MPRQRRNAYGPDDLSRMRSNLDGYISEEEWLPIYEAYVEENGYIPEEDFLEEYETLVEGRDFNGSIIPYKEQPISRGRYHKTYPQVPNVDILPYVDSAYDEYNYQKNRSKGKDLIDPKTGRRWQRKLRGHSDDPNYFWEPFNRRTNRGVDNTAINDFLINRMGITGGEYEVEPEPLTIMPLSFDPDDAFMEQYNKDKKDSIKNHKTPRVSDLDDDDVGPPIETGPTRNVKDAWNRFMSISSKNPGQFKSQSNVISYSNREYICDLVSTTSANLVSQQWTNFELGQYKFPINAGLNVPGFGQLSQIASCFQFYRFKKLKFIYLPTSGDSLSGTDTALGQVIFCINYSVGIPDPLTSYQMLNQQDSQVCKPSMKMEFEVDCSRFIEWYYTRIDSNTTTGSYNSNQGPVSIQLTDCANFYIALLSSQSANTVGQLWCEYEVDMRGSILSSSLLGSTILYWRSVSATTIANPNPSNQLYVEYAHHGSLGLQYIDTSVSVAPYTGSLYFPITITTGVYRVTFTSNWSPQGLFTMGNPNMLLNVSVLAGCNLISPLNAGYQTLASLGSGSDIGALYSQGLYGGLGTTNGGPWYSSFNLADQGGSAGSRFYSNSIVFYIQINQAGARINLTTTNVSGTANPVWGGSITVEQCNPDLVNSYNTYPYIVNG